MAPEISVILPVYNAENFIERCLQMLFSQTFRDFEVIAVDDGSIDRSLQLLESFAQGEPRLTVIHEKNSGPGIARNTGMAKATGTYIMFLDPDDHFSPSMLGRLHAAATKHTADVVVCRSARITFDDPRKILPAQWALADDMLPTDRPLSRNDVAGYVFQDFLGWPWDKLFRLDFLRDNSLTYPALRNSEDGVMVFPALCLSERTVVLSDILVKHMTGRGGSVSNSRSAAPLCLFQAEEMISETLKADDVYDLFERSFVNWAVHYCLWHLDTLDMDAQKTAFEHMRGSFIPKYRSYLEDDDFFYDRFDLLKMKAIERYDFEDYHFFRTCIKAYEHEIESIGDDIRSSKTYRLGNALAAAPRAVMRLVRPDREKANAARARSDDGDRTPRD